MKNEVHSSPPVNQLVRNLDNNGLRAVGQPSGERWEGPVFPRFQNLGPHGLRIFLVSF
jgi:hypothetical protein